MSVRLIGFDVRELFSHALLWGAAAIAEDGGVRGVRMSWSGGGLSPVAELAGDGLDDMRLAGLIRAHAVARASEDGWIDRPFPLEPERGLFSPRVKAMGEEPATWDIFERARRDALDGLVGSVGDLRMIGALGEPAWWVRARNGPRLDQDAGASRLEMQPRNRGSEFIASRLRPLTAIVADRSDAAIARGLTGGATRDDMGKGASDSRTATNLRPLGPTDDAAGYVALWGLSCSSLIQGRNATSATSLSTPLGQSYPSAFVVPVWDGEWTPARLRSVLGSRALATVSDDDEGQTAAASAVAVRWLREHRVRGLIRMPIVVTGSSSAPERRAVLGARVSLPAA